MARTENPSASNAGATNQYRHLVNNAFSLGAQDFRETPDLIEQFSEEMRKAGCAPPREIIADSKVHRYQTHKGDKKKSVWYIAHLDGVPNIIYGDWQTGARHYYSPSGKPLNHAQRELLAKQIEAAKAAWKAEKAQKRERAEKRSAEIWGMAKPASPLHPYLERKGVQPHGLREYSESIVICGHNYKGSVIVPIWHDGKLVGLQFIPADPSIEKAFLPGTSITGNYFVIGDIEHADTVCIAEGFATAASIYEATGIPCLVAFNKDNLLAGAKRLKLLLPGVEVTICGDDDWRTKDKDGNLTNPGRKAAREAALAIGAKLAAPDFGSHRDEKWTDLNDLAVAHGADKVCECIAKAAYVATDQPSADNFYPLIGPHIVSMGEFLKTKAPSRKWLVEGWLPKNQVTLFPGDGGLGKSTMAIQLAIAAATGTRWLGFDVQKTRVCILSAEDGRDELHYRSEKFTEKLVAEDRERAIKDLEGVKFIDATKDLDPILATFDEKKGIEPTKVFNELKQFIRAEGIELFIIDSSADVFAEEINRSAVRSFIRQLRSLNITVVLLSHPSVDGMKSERGYSGSTHWNNAVRSRLYIQYVTNEAGHILAPDLRALSLKKGNYGKTGQKIIVRWTENGFVRDKEAAKGLDGLALELKAEEVFLKLVTLFDQLGLTASPNPNQTYAPKVFAEHAQSEGISKKPFEGAMQRLLTADKIRITTEGPPSRQRKRLVPGGKK